MKESLISIYVGLIIFAMAACQQDNKQTETISDQRVMLSALTGRQSRSVIVTFEIVDKQINNPSVTFRGEHPTFWTATSPFTVQPNPGEIIEMEVFFVPEQPFIGTTIDTMVISLNDQNKILFPLRGLSSKALEGKNEPPLTDVVKALGFDIEIGWTTLSNNLKPDLQGEEIPVSLFKKASDGMVDMFPVARYSPPFSLPYGYYTAGEEKPMLHEVGIMSNTRDYPEHQTLYPAIVSGQFSFDPGNEAFGFYTTSPSHIAYSEDSWNAKLSEKNAIHACRIYPIKNHVGELVENQYLVCFEEAANGDYQDYVFLLRNIEVVKNQK